MIETVLFILLAPVFILVGIAMIGTVVMWIREIWRD